MSSDVRVKVCGLTSLEDAHAAAAEGAHYLGFIFHPNSPRYISPEAFKAIAAQLPPAQKKVGVAVYESMAELEQYKDLGLDYLQLHFPNDTPFFEAALWTEIIPPNQLWLAPRVPPGKEMDPAFFPLADHVLVDTYHEGGYGGSGQTGNWDEFSRLRGRFTKVTWILAGGLGPENISQAITQSGAQIVDVNSGVESAPGKKDHGKIKALFDALRAKQV
ncbi:phosphoribosylanthranilate isomerase [Nibricoccus sp. IMCC34717]|uniref:phosphoribosylanthranilate isomerase n=1 Tax=Nibricoccus sp. IMCC34717 TaxID=3034021 RepID=UPI00384E52AA